MSQNRGSLDQRTREMAVRLGAEDFPPDWSPSTNLGHAWRLLDLLIVNGASVSVDSRLVVTFSGPGELVRPGNPPLYLTPLATCRVLAWPPGNSVVIQGAAESVPEAICDAFTKAFHADKNRIRHRQAAMDRSIARSVNPRGNGDQPLSLVGKPVDDRDGDNA